MLHIVFQFLVITLLSLSLFSTSPAICSSTTGPSSIKSWCNKTPHPQCCDYFFTHNPKYNHPIHQKYEFLKFSLQLALDRALDTEKQTNKLGPKCRNEHEKAAWTDCLVLYKSTIDMLSRTVDPNIKCSQFDAQTWLSTALTNLETCKLGFKDVGVLDYVMSNNVSMLISNTLAMNKGSDSDSFGDDQINYKEGFPNWVGTGDRKLLQSSSPGSRANIVVSKDGSGNYQTINAAVKAAKSRSGGGRYVIYVKGGVYNEQVDIGNLKKIMLVGDGKGMTIITGSKSAGGGATIFSSATFAVIGDGFIARGITFKNTAGPQNHQAVALRSGSDLSVFYQCSFEGYQDTLFVHSQRQFYRECDIFGTVDFIFGNAAVVFQKCNIFARNTPTKTNTITAQGRTDPNQNTGISIHECIITAASDLKPVQGSVRTYLGRPWQKYSRTVVMKTFLDGLINSAGWMPWSGNFALSTLYYGEYMNTGPGSSTVNRVKWGGYHVLTSATEAGKFTVGNFIAGNSWLPATNVPFISGI